MADMAPPLVMTPEELRAWWGRIELARARRDREAAQWQLLLDGYLPPKDTNSDSINSNVHFRNVESKKAQLFFQLPDLQLTPLEPLQGLMDPMGQPVDPYAIIATKRAVLNKLLGRDHADVLHTINEALFDILATSGVAFTKICYEADFEPKPQQVPTGTIPMPGAVLGLQPAVQQFTEQIVDVPIYERWRWYHFSAKKGLIPHDWYSTRFDEAPFLAMEFNLPLDEAVRRKLVQEGHQSNATQDDLRFTSTGDNDRDSTGPRVKGVEVWSRAVQYRKDVYHSELFDYLVLIDGDNEAPAQYKPSPYQTIGQDGRLTADSMLGNPIHVITLRDCADTAWVPSDAAFTNPLVKQLNTWRAQDIKMRDSNLPRFFYAEGMKDAVDKLSDLDAGQGVPAPDDQMARGAANIIAAIPHLERAQSDIQGEASIERAVNETLALGSNQAASTNDKVHSATEIATVQQNANTRLQKERTVLIERFLSGARKFDALIQRFADTRDYVEIVGIDGAKRLQAWDKNLISGRYAFDAAPDSQLSNDAAKKRADLLEFVNFMAKSPFINQAEQARVVALAFGQDPARMIKQPDPPPQEKPNVSWAIKVEDFYGPGAEVARQLAEQAGVHITPDAIAMAKTLGALYAAAEAAKTGTQQPDPGAPKNMVHGGAADKADVISKHSADETGRMPGRTPEGAPPQQTSNMVQ